MAEEKKAPVIHQNGKALPVRNKKVLDTSEITILQKGKKVLTRNPIEKRDDYVIVQNGTAKHGPPHLVKKWNEENPKLGVKPISLDKVDLDPEKDFDEAVYLERKVQFEEWTPGQLTELYNKKTKIPAEDLRALIEEIISRNMNIAENKKADARKNEDNETYDNDVYSEFLDEYLEIKEGTLKKAYGSIKKMRPEQADAIKEAIKQRGINV